MGLREEYRERYRQRYREERVNIERKRERETGRGDRLLDTSNNSDTGCQDNQTCAHKEKGLHCHNS